MDREIVVTYTPAIIRRAIRRFWFRFIAWHGFASFAGDFVAPGDWSRDERGETVWPWN